MKVYVIMGNDYPDAAFRTEEAAEEYVADKIKKQNERKRIGPKIHWRWYEFELS